MEEHKMDKEHNKITKAKKFAKASPISKGIGEALTSKPSSNVIDLKSKFKSIEELKNHIRRATPEAIDKLCDAYAVKSIDQLLDLYRSN
tara:strand:+ start:419 stop:685 length:267 start_codon:yes stop_codon:yes gene_type:complete